MPGGENDRRIQGFGKRQCILVPTRVLDAATGNNNRLFCLAQDFGRLPDGIIGCGRHILRTVARGLLKIRVLNHLGQYIPRQIELHRTPARRHRGTERLAKHFRNPAGLRHGPGFFGNGFEQRLLIHFLERITVNMRRRQ